MYFVLHMEGRIHRDFYAFFKLTDDRALKAKRSSLIPFSS